MHAEWCREGGRRGGRGTYVGDKILAERGMVGGAGRAGGKGGGGVKRRGESDQERGGPRRTGRERSAGLIEVESRKRR